ncbi:hypothetical protein L226DRAFT_146482 [Lentinus tigrinus ALCF2SS1-7]|uniref:Uncharacterized protein n=1 Tax=Lentinus tigrinus ALCF2SS1-6 TaxID=1328759 RepID=A0A5C2SBB8_9APHY|nr:hypothetical protein L227DRAFT_564672 [Lentinus tigrinus ALCF2SS1-6]RPD72766.1 hypothetical protein L226DRAFT_146482 [Lentinus tigrinus ALCF2SS1-7]
MNTHFVRTTASNLAGPVRNTTTFIPAPSERSTIKAGYPTPRLNKADLELVLFRAQVRAHNRRVRESLGHGVPFGVAQRITHAPANSYCSSSSSSRSSTPSTPPSLSYPSTSSTLDCLSPCSASSASGGSPRLVPIPTFGESPYSRPVESPSPSLLPIPTFGESSYSRPDEAPSPSLLPIPTFGESAYSRLLPVESPSPSLLPIPTFGESPYTKVLPVESPSPSLLPIPTFGSPAPITTPPRPVLCSLQYSESARDMMGRSHSFVADGDPLTPGHVFPPTLRRTPGAPVWADDANSYFRCASA